MAPPSSSRIRSRGWSLAAALTTVPAALLTAQLAADLAADTAPVGPSAPASSGAAAPAAPGPARRAGTRSTGTVAGQAGQAGQATAAPDIALRDDPISAGDRLPGPVPPVPPTSLLSTARAAPPPAAAPAAPAAPRLAGSLCSGAGWQQRRGSAALASLRAGAERTGFHVEFAGARAGYLGLTHLELRRIEVFVRPCGTQSDELLRHVIAHELGHAFDTTQMNAVTRRAWQQLRGIALTTPWYGCSGCTDFATPAGDFAEVYAQWARGASSNRSQLAGDVPAAQLAVLARTFFGA